MILEVASQFDDVTPLALMYSRYLSVTPLPYDFGGSVSPFLWEKNTGRKIFFFDNSPFQRDPILSDGFNFIIVASLHRLSIQLKNKMRHRDSLPSICIRVDGCDFISTSIFTQFASTEHDNLSSGYQVKSYLMYINGQFSLPKTQELTTVQWAAL